MVKSNLYTYIFATIICLVSSTILSIGATTLKPIQLKNVEIDMKRNVLLAVDIFPETPDKIISVFNSNIKSDTTKSGLPLFILKDNEKVNAFILPISGKGLWGNIKGYLAIESDAKTVKGVAFYEHKETPGLGGEIEKDWFRSNFKGKKIVNENGTLTPIQIVKGKSHSQSTVDGIGGATLTSKGVNEFLKSDLENYESYLKKQRVSDVIDEEKMESQDENL